MRLLKDRKMRTLFSIFIALVIFVIGYLTFVWVDTASIMRQLNQITKEPPNSREMFKDDFWLLVPEADEDGNIVSYVTKITRDYTWVWGNEGTMRVHIFLTDDYPNSVPVNYQADWILSIRKINGKWEIVDYKNIP